MSDGGLVRNWALPLGVLSDLLSSEEAESPQNWGRGEARSNQAVGTYLASGSV